MSDGQIRVGIVGAGYWGPNLTRAFRRLPDSQVAWVCDKKPGRQQYIAAEFPDIPVTSDYADLLGDASLDAIVVATPVSTHYDVGMAALRAGKHVMIEKPMADTTEHAEELLRAGEHAHRVVVVDHLFVYNPAVAKMKELLTAGAIGTTLYAHSSRVNLGPPASEVDVIWDLATHDLAITYYLWGRLPAEVIAYGRRFLHPELVDVGFVHLRFDDETMAVHHVSWHSPEKVRQYFLAGSAGALMFDDTVAHGKLRQIDKGVDTRIGLKDDEAKELFYKPGTVRVPELEPIQPLDASCRDFLWCIQTGERPRADGHAGLAVVRLLEAVERSIVAGSRPIELR